MKPQTFASAELGNMVARALDTGVVEVLRAGFVIARGRWSGTKVSGVFGIVSGIEPAPPALFRQVEEAIASSGARRKEANDLHLGAMMRCDVADRFRKRGEERLVRRAMREALPLESSAAEMHPSTDWWRAVLFRSAATIALEGGLPDEAVRLVHRGLIATEAPVPAELAEELFDVLRVATEGPC